MNEFEGEIIVMNLFDRKIINLSTFDNIFSMKVHINFVIWTNYFSKAKKDKIRNNVSKYMHKPHKFMINCCNDIWKIGRKLQLLGGMFVEEFNEDIYEINDEIIDFSFLDTFMIENDEVMPQLLRVEVQRDENAGEVRFIPNEEIRNRYIEENERLSRDDKRWNQDIVRDNVIIDVEASVTMIIENIASLANKANEVAVGNINWNVNEPFILLSHIFENVIVCWK
jgi:hypothetical protein